MYSNAANYPPIHRASKDEHTRANTNSVSLNYNRHVLVPEHSTDRHRRRDIATEAVWPKTSVEPDFGILPPAWVVSKDGFDFVNRRLRDLAVKLDAEVANRRPISEHVTAI